jgi:hypothetical protein
MEIDDLEMFVDQRSCLKYVEVGTTVQEVDVCYLCKRAVFGSHHESNKHFQVVNFHAFESLRA